MTAKKLTASIVLFNTPRLQIESVLKSVFDSACVETLYIIDNSPNDKWRILEKRLEENGFTKIRYIHNENLGYGASHNLAMHEAIENESEYHVVLNPDIRFDTEVLPALIDFMDKNPDASYVLPKVVYPNGEIQYLCKLLPTPGDLIFRRFMPKTKWSEKKNDRYCLKNFGYDKVINPPCLSGCFMLMRLSVLAENNIFFDGRFFMYFEDFDILRRLHRVSKTLYFPGVQIIHDHQKESYKNRKMLLAHIKSAFRYFGKYGWWFDKERKEMNERVLREIENEEFLS
ncbi:glycosyltransferase [uncultured Treponema sp.]|uniref:glycosyltransferase n=1 Tax=uncultured Treponema sp. TaxID=162155 RepID=UPI0025F765C9|nr:glycosyltransferase family 2 protein [uncultured Treponema sp.]